MLKKLNVTGDIDSIDLRQLNLTRDPKKGPTILEFNEGDVPNPVWVRLTTQN